MTFQTVLEELNHLYEETIESKEVLHEDSTDDDEAIEIEDDAENSRIVIECTKCGALAIKDSADIVIDEASDLVNVDDSCQYCEEAAGFAIIGAVVPYAPFEEAVDEETTEEEVVEEAVTEDAVEDSSEAEAEVAANETEEPVE